MRHDQGPYALDLEYEEWIVRHEESTMVLRRPANVGFLASSTFIGTCSAQCVR